MSISVLQVLASTRADHGGTSRSVPALCEGLDSQGADVHLVTAAPKTTGFSTPILPDGNVRVHLLEETGLVSETLRSPFKFYRKLHEVVGQIEPDVIHDHGGWLPSNALAAWMAQRYDVPLVISPRGMFTSWSLSFQRWKKQMAWHGYQKHVMGEASCFHVTAEAEVKELRTIGLDQPATVIPNGVSVPDEMPSPPDTSTQRALFLSRVHPKKGLPMLLDVWARLRPDGWTLEIVGPDKTGHRAELEEQRAALNLEDTVHFAGPVEDNRKWDKYAAADLFVLPSHSENFGLVVAEALAAGLPVITTKGTPWSELEKESCGWWIDIDEDSFEWALREAIHLTPDERHTMGQRGRALVERQYSWPSIADRMLGTYRWIVGDGDAVPDWVRLS